MTTAEIAAAVGSTARADAVCDGVVVDSRTVQPGQLFVPLRGATTDGHRFVPTALAAGAAAYVTEQDDDSPLAIRVDDTLVALHRLTAAMRRRVPNVVGITGSVGKTTTKDLLAAALAPAFAVHANQKSFNNHVGVPLTVLNAPDGTEVLITEIGTNGRGEIRHLSELAQPSIAVVTRVSAAHLAGFGTLDGVAEEKSDLVRSLSPQGIAVLNADDERVLAMRSLAPAVLTYGTDAEVRVTVLRMTGDMRPVLRYETPWGSAEGLLAARGRHQATNAGAAVAVAGHLGVGLDDAVAAMSEAAMSPGRMVLRTLPGGAVLIDDSYNANPESIKAALAALAELPAPRKVAVLGEMAELGDAAPAAHREVAEFAAAQGVRLVAYRTGLYGAVPVDDVPASVGPLDGSLALLVKGSLVSGMAAVVAGLEHA